MEDMEIKNVLVTGGAGYIGSVLISYLIKNSYNVTSLDTHYFSKMLPSSKNFNIINEDIRNLKKIDLSNFDAIIHLAALSNDTMGELNQNLTFDINYHSSVDLARKAKEYGIKKFIFSSSCSVYGAPKETSVNERSKVFPQTTYAVSKLLAEKDLLKLGSKKFCVSILRNATVYGYSKNCRSDLVVNDFVLNALINKKINVKSDGTPWRPLIDIHDLSNVFILFLKAPFEKINKKIVNVGFNENNFQVKDLIRAVRNTVPNTRIYQSKHSGADARSYKVIFDSLKKLFPEVRQQWPLQRSIEHARLQFSKKAMKNITDINMNNRIFAIKKLLAERKLDNELYWIK